MNDKNVLIIDDEYGIRESLSVALHNDCNVITAGSGEEGLRLFREQPPSLVVLDINLPGMNGLEALRNFRVIDASLPVIMISGLKEIKNIVTSFRLGVVDFFCKPFNINEFIKTVNQILNKKQRMNANSEEKTISSDLENFIEKRLENALDGNLELKEALKTFDERFIDEIINRNARGPHKAKPNN